MGKMIKINRIDKILTFLRGREPSYIFSNIRVRKNFDSFGTKLSYLVSAASMPQSEYLFP